MSWQELSALGIHVRPLAGEQPRPGCRYSPFRASWRTTISLLAKELAALDAKRIALGLDIAERDIRLDGLPRADARIPNPTVELAFESKYGPLRYATCEYTSWHDNVRAIALAMQALRAVDRYGVSKRGEQYVGWKALPAGSDDLHGIPDTAAARAYLDDVYDGDMRRALMETHPDHGGDREEFGKVMRIKGLLGQ